MQVVTEEVRTCMATVTVEDSEEGAFGPALALLLRGFLHVKHNRHAVFVVVPDDALVRVRSVGFDDSVLLDRVLGRFEVGQAYVA